MTLLEEFEIAVRDCMFEILNKYTLSKDIKYMKLHKGQSILWNINRKRYSSTDRKVLVFLANICLPLNTSNRYGQTLLHVAIEEGNIQLFDDLISLQAAVDIPDDTGMTPLFYAVACRNTYFVEQLIMLEVNADSIDDEGWNPFMYLLIRMTQENEDLQTVYDIGKILLKHMNITETTKRNIEEICKYLDRMDIYKLLEN